jgi:hypothetical protein
MDITMRAIELTGSIDEQGQLHLDKPLANMGQGRVRVLLLFDEGDLHEQDWLKAAASNPAFEFLQDSAEDVYTIADGKPFRDEG